MAVIVLAFLVGRGVTLGQEALAPSPACFFFSEHPEETLYTFEADDKIEAYIGKLLSQLSRPENFSIVAANVPHAATVLRPDGRLLLYDQYTFATLDNSGQAKWRSLLMLSHQLAHHLADHALPTQRESRVREELEADRISGSILRKLGATESDVSGLSGSLGREKQSPLYPSVDLRRDAILNGWKSGAEIPQPSGVQINLAYVDDPADLEIPHFDWPPPRPSAKVTVTPDLLAKGRNPVRLIDVAQALELALEHAGYAEWSYYAVPDGFALAARLEQINPDGTPLATEARWAVTVSAPKIFSLSSYLQALFLASPGRYRVVVFIATSAPIQTGVSPPEFRVARDWIWSGASKLPPSAGIMEFGPNHACTALIYEFEQRSADSGTIQMDPSSLTGKIHLERSGIWQGLVR